jgi:transcriptional regulator with XRE-family HTH domain
MSFGARLRELRERAGLSQGGLAEAAGMSQAGISDLEQERGGRKPTWETVQKLATALGVSCEAFNEPAKDQESRGPGRPRKGEGEPAKGKKRKGA